jgi:hypothetical protein
MRKARPRLANDSIAGQFFETPEQRRVGRVHRNDFAPTADTADQADSRRPDIQQTAQKMDEFRIRPIVEGRRGNPYFEGIAVHPDYRARNRSRLHVNRQRDALLAAVEPIPAHDQNICSRVVSRYATGTMSSNWQTMIAASGERSTLPMGGMNRRKICRKGRVTVLSSGASGL